MVIALLTWVLYEIVKNGKMLEKKEKAASETFN